jgi:glycosyltransferase involved in cell wall biosynthesis
MGDNRVPTRIPGASVIVPAYNAEKTLAFCLEALGNQSHSKENFEVVVIDDGSTDRTAQIARRFRIIYEYQRNRGPAAARNKGAALAQGNVILFTDADCVPERNWVEEMIRPFKDPTVAAVKGAYRTKQKELAARFAQAEFEDRYTLLEKKDVIDMIDTYSAAFKRDVFEKAGGFDESFPVANNEDTDLSYRLATSGHKLVFNPKAIVYHSHPNSIFHYLRVKYWRGYYRIVVYRRFPEKAVSDSYTPKVIKVQTLLTALSLPLLFLSVFRTGLLALVGLIWSLVCLSSIPFSVKVFKKDRAVGLLSPLLVFLRAGVFALGSSAGLLHDVRPELPRIFRWNGMRKCGARKKREPRH